MGRKTFRAAKSKAPRARVTNRRGTSRALAAVWKEEFGGEGLGDELFRAFLDARVYEPSLAEHLISVAGARGVRPSWELRRAAVLMLEGLLLAAPEDTLDAFEHALRTIAERGHGGLTYPPGPSVLAEGYSSSEPRVFVAELRRRLGRLGRVHRGITGRTTPPQALREFLAAARDECRLTLARHLFSPHEVARKVFEQTRPAHGLPQPFESAMLEEASERLLAGWPEYERAVVAALLDQGVVYWVGDATSSRINALVEYPLGTVVLVVKPPGSSLEIEIKRAGRRGDRPLSVVFTRGGTPVPPSHRVDGGSLGGGLRSEAGAAALLGRLYRFVHGERPPVSQTIAIRSVHEVPCASGRASLLDYFTEPALFGQGFGAMRRDLDSALRAFRDEWEIGPLDVPGDLGRTVEFLGQIALSQAVLGSSTSFRLDLLASYLGDDGPEIYFTRGLGVAATRAESRRFADTLLDEILGAFVPVGVGYKTQRQYVGAVLDHPDNRRHADEVFLDLAAQVGRFWGTLLGLRGYTLGESFVGRNVGLKSGWEGGRWRTRFISMDHDMMCIPRDRFDPAERLRGSARDAAHVHGVPGNHWRSALDWLATIYRADAATAARGRAALSDAAASAARLARAGLATDARLRGQFHPGVLEDGADWDAAAAAFLRARARGRDLVAALGAASTSLKDRCLAAAPVAAWTDAIRAYSAFLEEHAALFGAADESSDRTC